ncbi:MAG: DUF488 domain-containing protein [Hungatella sp.]
MKTALYTIGHSQHKMEYFLQMLKTQGINYVLDVRSTPYSQFASEYNKENIRAILKNHNIIYSFMGTYFGARQKDAALYTKEGYLDFEKTKRYFGFQQGVQSVMKGLNQGYHIAFMCTEKDPIECHRAILVANAFYEMGIDVQHIMPDNTLQSHQRLNKRLLDVYFPDRNQISLFVEDNMTEDQCLEIAYREQNKKIGYHQRAEDENLVAVFG